MKRARLYLESADSHMMEELRGVLNTYFADISKITRETPTSFDPGTRKAEIYEYLFKGRTLKLIKFLLSDEALSKKELTGIFGNRVLDYLVEIGIIVKENAHYRASVFVHPFRGYYFIADKSVSREDDVFGLGREEEILFDCLPKNNKSVLDLCTGSGIFAILLAKSAEKVTAVDINPRAIRYAKFNAMLNSVNVEFMVSNLYENVRGKYDLIVSNPPYNPFFGGSRILSLHSGCAGDNALSGILRGLGRHLSDEGMSQIVGRYFYKGRSYRDNLKKIIDINKFDASLLMGKYPKDVFKLINMVEGSWSVKNVKRLFDFYKRAGIIKETFGVLNIKKGTGMYTEKVVDLFDRLNDFSII